MSSGLDAAVEAEHGLNPAVEDSEPPVTRGVADWDANIEPGKATSSSLVVKLFKTTRRRILVGTVLFVLVVIVPISVALVRKHRKGYACDFKVLATLTDHALDPEGRWGGFGESVSISEGAREILIGDGSTYLSFFESDPTLATPNFDDIMGDQWTPTEMRDGKEFLFLDGQENDPKEVQYVDYTLYTSMSADGSTYLSGMEYATAAIASDSPTAPTGDMGMIFQTPSNQNNTNNEGNGGNEGTPAELFRGVEIGRNFEPGVYIDPTVNLSPDQVFAEEMPFASKLSPDGNTVAFWGQTEASEVASTLVAYRFSTDIDQWVPLGKAITIPDLVFTANGKRSNANHFALSYEGNRIAMTGPVGKADFGSAFCLESLHQTIVLEFSSYDDEWITVGEPLFFEGSDSYNSVALNAEGGRLAIGISGHHIDGCSSEPGTFGQNGYEGAIRVFDWVEDFDSFDSARWMQVGASVSGTKPGERIGYSLSMSLYGDRILYSAPSMFRDGSASHIQMLELIDDMWVTRSKPFRADTESELSGYNIALDPEGNFLLASPDDLDSVYVLQYQCSV